MNKPLTKKDFVEISNEFHNNIIFRLSDDGDWVKKECILSALEGLKQDIEASEVLYSSEIDFFIDKVNKWFQITEEGEKK